MLNMLKDNIVAFLEIFTCTFHQLQKESITIHTPVHGPKQLIIRGGIRCHGSAS